jgi:amino acid permease
LIRVFSGETVTIWVFYGVTILILAPLAWIRTLESLRYGFIFGAIVIFGTVLVVSIFDIMIIENEHNGEAGDNWQPLNEDHVWTMIALSFYMFEGIPSVLPIMESSNSKDNFHWIIAAALSTLCAINIAFSELCYYTFGDGITEPIIILQMPEENPVIITDKILFCIMICFSYPLIVYACNQVIESFLFSKMEYSATRKWLKNLSRTINLALALAIAITFYYSLHKILGFSAVVFGSVIVLVFPAIIHNKLVAETSL